MDSYEQRREVERQRVAEHEAKREEAHQRLMAEKNARKDAEIAKIKKIVKLVGLGLVAVGIGMGSWGYNDGGVNTRLQQPVLGHKWIKEEGFYFKVPLLSRTRAFNKNGTLASTDNADLIEASSITIPPTVAPFADSFDMRFEWSVRYETAMDDETLEFMYQKLKSQEALLGNTLMPFAQTLFTDSVNQMIGENFAQGGKNSLRTLIDNQSQFGMYQTRVEKVKVDRQQGKGSNDVLGGVKSDLEVTKVIYLTDDNGKRLRTSLSIAQYGIKIVPNSFQIVENKAMGRLVTFIDKKQRSLELQIEQDEKQVLLGKLAKTEELNGDLNLIKQTNKLNITKEQAIIAAEQRVSVAELQADKEIIERQKVSDLAVIDKDRELQIAEANEGIQRANATAAKHQADSIKLVGFAKAAVKKADYNAIDKEVLRLEVDKAKALALYKSNMVVNMPMIVGGGDSESSNIENMSSLKVLELLGSPVK